MTASSSSNNGSSRPQGLVNLGNTCFMNAALQCLARTPKLLDSLMVLIQNPLMTFNGFTATSNSEEGDGTQKEKEIKLILDIPQESMIYKMTELLRKITSGGNSPVNPGAVHSVMCTSEFTAGMQHDSHELLRSIIDKMKKEQIKAIRSALLQSVGVSKKEAASLQEKDPQKAAELKELDKKLHQKTIMDEIFGGELMTTRTCLVCNYVKTSREEFLDLSLPIRENRPSSYNNNSATNRNFYSNESTTVNRSLTECLQRFTAPEILIDSNSVDCEKCHENKINLVKSGTPVEQVFPRPPPPPSPVPSSQGTKNSIKKEKGKHKRYSHNNNHRQQQQQQPPPPPPLPQQSTISNVQQQTNRRRRRKKTRADKIADDHLAAELASAATTTTSITTTPTSPLIVDDVQDEVNKEEIQESDSQQDSKELVENEIMSENEKHNLGVESSSSDLENMPELEKVVPDEGYAEDYKESDDDVPPPENENNKMKMKRDNINEEDGEEEEEEDDDDDVGDDDNVTWEEEDKSEDKVEQNGEKEPKYEIPKSTKSPSRGQTMIARPPNNLTIQLKRFTCGLRGLTLKLQDHVKFSEYIDIKDFVTTSEGINASYSCEDNNTITSNETNLCHLKSSPSLHHHHHYSNGSRSNGFDTTWTFDDMNEKEPDILGGGDTNEINSETIVLPHSVPHHSSSSSFVKDNSHHHDQDDPEYSHREDEYDIFNNMGVMGQSSENEASSVVAEADDDVAFAAFDSQADFHMSPRTSPNPSDDEEEDGPPVRDDPTDSYNIMSVSLNDTQPSSDQQNKFPTPETNNTNTTTTTLEEEEAKWVNDNEPMDATTEYEPSSCIIPLGWDPSPMDENPTTTSIINNKVCNNDDEEENMNDDVDTSDPNGIRYRLYGIVEHSGSLHWGHYVAYVRVNNDWFYISDSYVSPSKLSDVLARCPYMLFYERVL